MPQLPMQRLSTVVLCSCPAQCQRIRLGGSTKCVSLSDSENVRELRVRPLTQKFLIQVLQEFEALGSLH